MRNHYAKRLYSLVISVFYKYSATCWGNYEMSVKGPQFSGEDPVNSCKCVKLGRKCQISAVTEEFTSCSSDKLLYLVLLSVGQCSALS